MYHNVISKYDNEEEHLNGDLKTKLINVPPRDAVRHPKDTSVSDSEPKDVHHLTNDQEWSKSDAMYCYRYLLLFNAALLSYAHGKYIYM